jgi:hypothetical protein
MTDPITVQGLRGLNRDLRDLSEDLGRAAKAAARDAVEPVADTARSIAPYDEGTLRATIKTGATLRAATIKAGGRRAPGAPLLHFGAVRDRRSGRRRNISPDPFLYVALDRRRQDVRDAYLAQLTKLTQTFPYSEG